MTTANQEPTTGQATEQDHHLSPASIRAEATEKAVQEDMMVRQQQLHSLSIDAERPDPHFDGSTTCSKPKRQQAERTKVAVEKQRQELGYTLEASGTGEAHGHIRTHTGSNPASWAYRGPHARAPL